MKKLQAFLKVLTIIVKWAGVVMVLVDTVKFFNTRMKEEVGKLDTDDVEPENIDTDGSKLAE